MGRAEDLFRRLCDFGEKAIDELIMDRQSEELFLDFKCCASSIENTNKLHDNDRKSLGRAISGFGNSEGGVIIWGVDCRDVKGSGDLPQTKVPIRNPKRFLSWLEGAVSGCTIPAHSLVQHKVIEIGTSDTGFVITYIPKSYFAPHQYLKELQYLIRAGSNSVPAPHSVLEGMFGRRPQPSIFHMWSFHQVKILSKNKSLKAINFDAGFMIGLHGPGIARDIYLNVKMSRPEGPSTIEFYIPDAEKGNWSGHHAFNFMTNLVSKDHFKLAPEAITRPLVLHFSFIPPFKTELYYEITFGHSASPVRKVEARVEPERIHKEYDEFLKKGIGKDNQQAFIRNILDLKDNEDYE